MNIAVIGMGGVGGYFGGKLSQIIDQNSGIQLYFIARGKHLEIIKEKGLLLKTADEGEKICRPTLATDDFKLLPDLDICLICVKSYDLDEVLKNIKDKIKPHTVIIPLLNGVDIYERIRKIIAQGVVYPSCVYVGTHIETYGVVAQNGGSCTIIFGPDSLHNESIPSQVFELFNKAGIKYSWSERYLEEIWTKYIFIAAYGIITASENKTLGEVYADKALGEKVICIMKEIQQIAYAKGIMLPKAIAEDSFRKAGSFPYEAKTSFQRDYEKKSGRDERELFGKAMIDMAKEFRLETPYLQMAYDKL